jgi:hypothetical protein
VARSRLRPLGLPRDPTPSDLKQAIEGLPFSYFSTADGPNTSGVSAPLGFLGIEIGSCATKLWFKQEASSLTTGWSQVSLI